MDLLHFSSPWYSTGSSSVPEGRHGDLPQQGAGTGRPWLHRHYSLFDMLGSLHSDIYSVGRVHEHAEGRCEAGHEGGHHDC